VSWSRWRSESRRRAHRSRASFIYMTRLHTTSAAGCARSPMVPSKVRGSSSQVFSRSNLSAPNTTLHVRAKNQKPQCAITRMIAATLHALGRGVPHARYGDIHPSKLRRVRGGLDEHDTWSCLTQMFCWLVVLAWPSTPSERCRMTLPSANVIMTMCFPMGCTCISKVDE
jgi:glutaredoxin-related protein